LILAAIACGGSPVGYSEIDEAMELARCEHLVRCKLVPDEAYCHELLRVLPDPSISAAIAAHKIDYDGERARGCVDATASQGCDLAAGDAHTPPPACSEMFIGRVVDGDACSIDAECASGACVLPLATCPENACCVGACRATRASGGAGDACDNPRDCKSGLVCGQDRTCRAPGAVGEPCRIDRECRDGLACLGASSSPGSCGPLPRAGEPCPYQRCAEENLRCDEGTHRCTAVGLHGDPCSTLADCSIDMECDLSAHVCREFPSIGMPCQGTCVGDSFCALDDTGTTGLCVALLPDNAQCGGDQECVSAYCPDGPIFRSCVPALVCF